MAPNISRRFHRDGASPIGGMKDSSGRRGMKDSIDSGELLGMLRSTQYRANRSNPAQSNVQTQDKVDDNTMIKVFVLARHIGAALTMVGLSQRVTSEWRGCPHTAGVPKNSANSPRLMSVAPSRALRTK
jgi:hypothetical protein